MGSYARGANETKIKEEELRVVGKRREVTKVRGEIAYRLSRELGLSLAEIARQWGSAPRQSGCRLG